MTLFSYLWFLQHFLIMLKILMSRPLLYIFFSIIIMKIESFIFRFYFLMMERKIKHFQTQVSCIQIAGDFSLLSCAFFISNRIYIFILWNYIAILKAEMLWWRWVHWLHESFNGFFIIRSLISSFLMLKPFDRCSDI